jgi:hypothetical protein
LPPALITSKDQAGQGVGSSKQGAGGVKIAAVDAFTDSGAADGLAVHLDGAKAMNRKTQMRPELFEKREIAMTPIPEGKVGSHAEAADVAEVANQITDELFGRDSAETSIKRNQPGDIESEMFQSTQALGE